MLHTMATTFPPTFAGFHFGIMFTTRNASSSISLPKLFIISASRIVPSVSTTKFTKTVPGLLLAGFLKFLLTNSIIASCPPGYSASSSTT